MFELLLHVFRVSYVKVKLCVIVVTSQKYSEERGTAFNFS